MTADHEDARAYGLLALGDLDAGRRPVLVPLDGLGVSGRPVDLVALDEPSPAPQPTHVPSPLGQTFANLVEAMRPGVEAYVAHVRAVVEAMGPAFPHAPSRTADPQAHALWLRQHRNTGPPRPEAGRARRTR